MFLKLLFCCVFMVLQFKGTSTSNYAVSESKLRELLKSYRAVGVPPKANGMPPKSPRDVKDDIIYHMARVMLKARELKDSRNQVMTTPAPTPPPSSGREDEQSVGGVPPCVLDWLLGVLEEKAEIGAPDRRAAPNPVKRWNLGDTDGGNRATDTTPTRTTSTLPPSTTTPIATTTQATQAPPISGVGSLPQWLIDLLKRHGLWGGK